MSRKTDAVGTCDCIKQCRRTIRKRSAVRVLTGNLRESRAKEMHSLPAVGNCLENVEGKHKGIT